MKNVYSENYNALPDVIEADEELTKMGRDTILDPLLQVIAKHDLEELVGLRLLHNHNQISKDEIMLEREEVNRDENCLTTKATRLSDVGEGFYPNSWALTDTLIPLEYSSDPSIKEDSHRILTNQSFIKDFKNEVNRLGVDHLLGLYVLQRQFFEKGKPNLELNYELVETTDVDRRANIITYKKSSEIEEGSLIDTVWAYQNNDITMGCERVKVGCSQLGCKVVVIRCIEDGFGGHERKVVQHDKLHGKDYDHVFKP